MKALFLAAALLITSYSYGQESSVSNIGKVCECWGWSQDGQHPDFKGLLTEAECNLASGHLKTETCQ